MEIWPTHQSGAVGRPLRRHEVGVAAALFCAVIALAFPQIVFFGKSLVATDNTNPLDSRYTSAAYGPGFLRPEELSKRGIVPWPNLYDPGAAWWQAEPNLHFFRRAIYSGEFPFWDPSAAGGAPVYCNLSPSLLFPPQIALSLLGATSTQKNFYILFLFWVCGFGTYCLLRLHQLGSIGSGAGGLAFLFSGGIQQIVHINFIAQVVACIPLLLIATRLFINEPSWRRTSLLAATYAMVALATFPPVLLSAFLLTVLYFAVAMWFEDSAKRRTALIRYAAGATLSAMLVAVYYLPTFLTIQKTTHITAWYRDQGMHHLPFRSIAGIFSATAAGGEGIYSAPIFQPTQGHIQYVGVAVLVLALLAFGRGLIRARPLVISCAIMAAFVLLKIFGIPPVQWIGLLPVFCNVHYTLYFGIILAFAVSVLAGIGMERVYTRLITLPTWAVVNVTVIGGLTAFWIFAKKSGALQPRESWRWLADYKLVVLFAIIAAIITGASALRSTSPRTLRALACLLMLLISIEGVVNATYPRQNRWDVFHNPPAYVWALKKMEPSSRVFVRAALNANLGSAFGIDELDSLYTFVSPRIFELYLRYAKAPAWIFLREATAIPPEQVLDRAGIGRLLIRHEVPVMMRAARERNYRVAYDDDYVSIFDRGPAPRAFFSSEYVVTDRTNALNLIATAPPRQIILESPIALPSRLNLPDDPEPQFLSTKLNSMVLRLHAPRPGLLYVADTFDDGWSVKLNGQPSNLMIANYAFRAVAIPEGEVKVELSYLPPGLVPGGILSLFGIIGVIGFAFLPTKKKQSFPTDPAGLSV